jgi:hypothetical protein
VAPSLVPHEKFHLLPLLTAPQGQATDIAIQAEEIMKLKKQLYNIYAKHTKQSLQVIGKHPASHSTHWSIGLPQHTLEHQPPTAHTGASAASHRTHWSIGLPQHTLEHQLLTAHTGASASASYSTHWSISLPQHTLEHQHQPLTVHTGASALS